MTEPVYVVVSLLSDENSVTVISSTWLVDDTTARIHFQAANRYYDAVRTHQPPSERAVDYKIKKLFTTCTLLIIYLYPLGFYDHAREYEMREGESLPESDATIPTGLPAKRLM
jgi:hypothetical protein